MALSEEQKRELYYPLLFDFLIALIQAALLAWIMYLILMPPYMATTASVTAGFMMAASATTASAMLLSPLFPVLIFLVVIGAICTLPLLCGDIYVSASPSRCYGPYNSYPFFCSPPPPHYHGHHHPHGHHTHHHNDRYGPGGPEIHVHAP